MANPNSAATTASPVAINLDDLASQLAKTHGVSKFDGDTIVYSALVGKLNEVAESVARKVDTPGSVRDTAKHCLQAIYALIVVRMASGVETTSISRLLSRYFNVLGYALAGKALFRFEDFISEKEIKFAANELFELDKRDFRMKQKAFVHRALQFDAEASPEWGKFGTLSEIGELNAEANRQLYEATWFQNLGSNGNEA